MEGLPPADREAYTNRGFNKNLAAVILLLLLIIPLRVWIVCHTEVCARDSIGYIRYALEFEKLTFTQTLQKNCQHPGYPLAILAVSWPVRCCAGEVNPYSMQLSAQLASTLAAIILIIPMYYLGLCFFDRRIAFWGVLLFQLLPGSGQILSDGLSEAVFFLWCVCAVLFAVRGVEGKRWRDFAWAGFFSGLSYLTRPEGALILIALCLVLVGKQAVPSWRWPWRAMLLRGGIAVALAGAVGCPYLLATGGVSNKPTLKIILDRMPAPKNPRNEVSRIETLPDHPLLASLFAATVRQQGSLPWRIYCGLYGIIQEIVQATHYLGQIPILIALWFNGGLLRQRPGSWVVTVWCLLQTAAVCALALKVGYVSDRHIMVFVLVAAFFLAWALCELPARMFALGLTVRQWIHVRGRGIRARAQEVGATATAPSAAVLKTWAYCSYGLLAILITVSLAKTLQPLHANRAGQHAAGCWLAEHLQAGDYVQDDHCWSHYYAGRVFEEDHLRTGGPAALPASYQKKRFVVMTRSRDEEIAKERLAQEADLRARNGRVVYYWPTNTTEQKAKVVVYAVAD